VSIVRPRTIGAVIATAAATVLVPAYASSLGPVTTSALFAASYATGGIVATFSYPAGTSLATTTDVCGDTWQVVGGTFTITAGQTAVSSTSALVTASVPLCGFPNHPNEEVGGDIHSSGNSTFGLLLNAQPGGRAATVALYNNSGAGTLQIERLDAAGVATLWAQVTAAGGGEHAPIPALRIRQRRLHRVHQQRRTADLHHHQRTTHRRGGLQRDRDRVVLRHEKHVRPPAVLRPMSAPSPTARADGGAHRKCVAVGVAIGAFAVLTAAAATLGGLTSKSLGAGQTVVSPCDSDGIALAYLNVYDGTLNSYKTTAVTMNSVAAACTGEVYKLTLSDGTASLGENTGVVALVSGSQTVTLATPIDTKLILKAALVITG
jgi:hypothetical protein